MLRRTHLLLLAALVAAALPAACAPAAPPARVAAAAPAPAFQAPVDLRSGDARLAATMYVAEGAGPHPTAIVLHGFPGGPRWAWAAEALQRAGINALFLHYRGTWTSEGEFALEHALDDARAAAAYLRGPLARVEHRVDPSAVVLVGHSLGGWVALHTTARAADLPCVAALGVADIGHFGRRWGADPAYRAAWTASLRQASEGPGAPVRLTASTEALVAQAVDHAEVNDLATLAEPLQDRAVLLVGAARDEVTPVDEHHARVRDALRAAGPVRLREVMLDDGHDFTDTRDELIGAVAGWVRGECIPLVRAPRR